MSIYQNYQCFFHSFNLLVLDIFPGDCSKFWACERISDRVRVLEESQIVGCLRVFWDERLDEMAKI